MQNAGDQTIPAGPQEPLQAPRTRELTRAQDLAFDLGRLGLDLGVPKYDRVLRLLESPMEQVAAALTGRWQTAREISDRDGRERWRK